MDKYQILTNINNLIYNSKLSIEIFKYIVKNKIIYSINNNNIYFELSILSLSQLNDIINILNN